MRRILVLGAGKSSPYLIRDLLGRAEEENWLVSVADRDPDVAGSRVAGHPRGEAVAFDVESDRLEATVGQCDLVVNLLPPELQETVARTCVKLRRPMISPAYATPEIRALADDAARRGVLLLMEMGLDPGIDHMATMSLVDRVHAGDGIVDRFDSYGGGLPAPESADNPLRYAMTWNPSGVVAAGSTGAQFLSEGRLRVVPYSRVFAEIWRVEVSGLGSFEAYPNRDSLIYREIFGLAQAGTLRRATLRYPGFCAVWLELVRLGLTNDGIVIPHLGERSWRQVMSMFVPGPEEDDLERRTASFLGLDSKGAVFEALRWLGLFSDEPIGVGASTAAEALVELLRRRLALPPDGRDMIVLVHDLGARFPRRGGHEHHRVIGTLVAYGEPGGMTAMAKTVGLPLAIGARLTLDGQLTMAGCRIPTEPAIYVPILAELEVAELTFVETSETLPAVGPRRRSRKLLGGSK